MPNVGKIVSAVAKAAAKKAGTKTVKVSPNVTVKAQPRKTISTAETLRLGNINKPTGKLKPKYQAKADKADKKLMKAAAKPKPRTDTKYTRTKSSSPFESKTVTARELAKEAVAQRAAKRAGRAY